MPEPTITETVAERPDGTLEFHTAISDPGGTAADSAPADDDAPGDDH
jgi:hypothetical protein